MVVVLPIILIVLTFAFLSPSIGFKLFPSGDNPTITFEITGREGMDTEAMLPQASGLDIIAARLPEVKSYEININNNTINLELSLLKKEERQRDSFAVQTEVETSLEYLKTQ